MGVPVNPDIRLAFFDYLPHIATDKGGLQHISGISGLRVFNRRMVGDHHAGSRKRFLKPGFQGLFEFVVQQNHISRPYGGRLEKYQFEIAHIKAGREHGFGITALEISPHCSAEKIYAAQANTLVEQEMDLGQVFGQPRLDRQVLFGYGHLGIIFVVAGDIDHRLVPRGEKQLERGQIIEDDDIAGQDEDIGIQIARKFPSWRKLKMQIAVNGYFHKSFSPPSFARTHGPDSVAGLPFIPYAVSRPAFKPDWTLGARHPSQMDNSSSSLCGGTGFPHKGHRVRVHFNRLFSKVTLMRFGESLFTNLSDGSEAQTVNAPSPAV
jgi:hypothetical protein